MYRKLSKYSFEENVLMNDNSNNFFESENGHWKREYQPREFIDDSLDPLLNEELKGIIQSCMQKLPALWLSVFTMKHMDDESTDFICKQLKVTASYFWVIIHRTKVSLRACLEKNWI